MNRNVKIIVQIAIFLLAPLSITQTVFADMGTKESTTVAITGFTEGESFYATLLGETQENGPHSGYHKS